ncbi:MAG: hypothetical protein KDK97_14750, partial [Verrucomicrobiales bacterium]|nr:hypothetical protein [Verrucomicrobiales bacterium]
LVEGAEDWRWSGWSAALAGDRDAIGGLCDVLHCTPKEWVTWARGVYSVMVSERRSEVDTLSDEGSADGQQRRTLLVKIPEFSRSLVIGEPGGGDGGQLGDTQRSRRSRMGVVMGLPVQFVAGNGRD